MCMVLALMVNILEDLLCVGHTLVAHFCATKLRACWWF
jgi:hypothetical protein